MPQAPRQAVFLATTALEEFWDTSIPIVFLGTWCRRFSRRTAWEHLRGETLELPYSEEQALELFQSLSLLYDRILGVLADRLNSLHGVGYSRRYWEILAGPWLLYYLHATYDRYACLRSALSSYPQLTTLCLAQECFAIPTTTLDFVQSLKSDAYNLQLYSNILRHMGRSYPCRRLHVSMPPPAPAAGYGRRMIDSVLALFEAPQQILHVDSYFPRPTLLQLTMRTAGRFWPATSLPKPAGPVPVNREMRDKLMIAPWGEGEFDRMLFPLIADDMPKSLLENYALTARRIKERCVRTPKAIFSSDSWHYDDVFKHWAARASEGGTLLLGEQHGGNYGSLACFLQERHELSITDRYYSWGWQRKGCRAQVVPRPPAKLMGRAPIPPSAGNVTLLYILAVWPRNLLQFPLTTRYWDAYFDNLARFLRALSPGALARLRLRPHREDMGWDVLERLRLIAPSVPIEKWNISLSQSLADCALFICDHPFYSTTFIEALCVDKPTVLFHDPRLAGDRPHEDAVDAYEGLASAGILWNDPEQAAAHVNSIFEHISDWWNEAPRRKAVQTYLQRFARTPPDAADEWAREINSLLV